MLKLGVKLLYFLKLQSSANKRFLLGIYPFINTYRIKESKVIFFNTLVYNNNLLLNIQFRSLLGPRGLLYIYIGRKLYLRKPHNPSPCLLGLAYKAPIKYLQVIYNIFTILLFNLFRNYCYCNKPINALVLLTLLYYYRVIRGRPLLTPLFFIVIFFTT